MSAHGLIGKDVRIVGTSGNSLVITIPKEYADEYNIKKGSKVTIYYHNSILYVEPVTDEEILEKVTRGIK